jgi:uncharacterized SAM-binding protein YcdF (DUF218 family)
VVALALATALWLARAPLLTSAGRFLDVSEPPCRADVVYVLGGDLHGRPAVAAALYKAGLARQVLVPVLDSSVPDTGADMPTEHEIVRRVLCKRGVPEEAIRFLPGPVHNTVEEAAALRTYLEANPGRTVMIVTTDFHTRRARMLFRRSNPDASLHFIAAPAGPFDATNWWQSGGSCATYLIEFVKLAAYSMGR